MYNTDTRPTTTTTTAGVNAQQQWPQAPAMHGQFGQFSVEQGQGGMPYFQGGYPAYNPYMMMSWVPMNDRMVSIPVPMLQSMEANLTANVQRAQENNMQAALSVLQSAIFCVLRFKEAFGSWFSKGDDSTQLHNLAKCIVELKQANISQKEASTHPFGCLVTQEKLIITNTRELFEHCIKIIEEIIPVLGGRVTPMHTYEKPLQIYTGWRGWQQQAEQINVSNRILGRLLAQFMTQNQNDAEKAIYNEILCFQQSVAYTIDCFGLKKYPNPKVIEEIYHEKGFEFVTELKEAYHSLQGVVESQSQAGNQDSGEETGEDESVAQAGLLARMWGSRSTTQ